MTGLRNNMKIPLNISNFSIADKTCKKKKIVSKEKIYKQSNCQNTDIYNGIF